jgi:hypothetical protein
MAELQGMTVKNQTSQSYQFQVTYNSQSYTQVVDAGGTWAVPGQFPCDQWVNVAITDPPERSQAAFSMSYQALNAKEVMFVDDGGAYALNCLAGVCSGGCDTQVSNGDAAARRA